MTWKASEREVLRKKMATEERKKAHFQMLQMEKIKNAEAAVKREMAKSRLTRRAKAPTETTNRVASSVVKARKRTPAEQARYD
ncbi:hypothetical protein AAFF_G00099070 [Aldrovandia affinis]|uniref:Uncharacterized protein n=1 Tax=Aldrovandia affinis TaxID=143900 RepID=A0AAD7RV18_9TELE|nr:hypothetical protein AAFF_G00099070 [Aldrovandia affinis]